MSHRLPKKARDCLRKVSAAERNKMQAFSRFDKVIFRDRIANSILVRAGPKSKV